MSKQKISLKRGTRFDTKTPSETRLKSLICLGLALVTLVVYLQTTAFSFTTYDDQFFVTENQIVQQGLSLENFYWAVTAVSAGTWQPVTWLSHMLDCQIFGVKAGGHHLVNILWHVANTLLLFLLLNRLTTSLWRSAMVAGLFALHPLHVESVAWIAERRDVLSTFFWFLTMWIYAAWTEKKSIKRYGLLIAAFAGGLMAKPMLVTVPVVLLLWDIWPLKRLQLEGVVDLWGKRRGAARLVVEKLPLFALALALGIITMIAVEKNGDIGTLQQYPLLFRIENSLVAYLRYLLMTFWPFGLLPFYPYEPIPAWQSLGSLFVLIGISFTSLRTLKRFPYLAVGWFWFLITLLPVIGLIQQGSGFALADRYTYVPLIGIFIMVSWGGGDLAVRFGWPRQRVLIIAGLVLIVCGVLSFKQTGYWRDTRTLFGYTLAVDPENRIGLSQLGTEARERGAYGEAEQFLTKAVALYPEDFEALANLAKLYEKMQLYAEAVRYFQEALRVNPNDSRYYVDLGIIMARQGNFQAAQNYFASGLELQPDNAQIRMNLAFVFLQQQNYSAALQQFSRIIKANPDFAEAYNGMGIVYLEQNRLPEAIKSFRTALRLMPDLRIARENLNTALDKSGATAN